MIGSEKKSHMLCFKIFDLFFSAENNIMVNLWLVGVTSLCPNSFLIKKNSLEKNSLISYKKLLLFISEGLSNHDNISIKTQVHSFTFLRIIKFQVFCVFSTYVSLPVYLCWCFKRSFCQYFL